MRNPAEMEVIQIEITNACIHTCSNCTRFCGHHKKPFYMDFETFKRAVDSLKGFTGVVGIMGGEPTLHPQFEQFTLYLNEKFKMNDNMAAAVNPVSDFLKYTRSKHNAYRVMNKCSGPGLWTSITKNYYKHYELIQETFTFQSLNDHSNVSYHQPVLVSRKDLGIADEEWFKIRDKCWIQNCWSASITPKGAFFCEIAASMDMLFNGPGGWPIEKDWWDIDPSKFGEQLKWCEYCGIAIDMFRRNANEGITDVSPSVFANLEKTNSPLLGTDKIKILDKEDISRRGEYSEYEEYQYIEDFSKRLKESEKYLKPEAITSIQIDYDDKWENFGLALYNEIQTSESDWILLIDDEFEDDKLKKLNNFYINSYLNPGVIYMCYNYERTYLFNKRAKSFKRFGFDRLLRCTDIREIEKAWDLDKRSYFDIGKDYAESDEEVWRMMIIDEFTEEDKYFRKDLGKMLKVTNAKMVNKVVVTQSASYFLTLGLIILLRGMNIDVVLITHRRFKDKFEGYVKDEDIYVFDKPDAFDFEALKPLLDEIICEKHKFDGAIVPYSVPRRRIVDEDGYQNIEKCAEYLGGKVLARINIKRNFVEKGFDTDGKIFANQWGY